MVSLGRRLSLCQETFIILSKFTFFLPPRADLVTTWQQQGLGGSHTCLRTPGEGNLGRGWTHPGLSGPPCPAQVSSLPTA